ncbi:hypothetical protein E0F76_06190 [Flavobacterium cellulosilyticum]|uniref:Outermembrane protein n=1 Tax=Flavobacterium cellulosilyticum TaxID=2541731 RepID=A0A4R5CMP6_9FLAO|nr:hypothetical protein [Flavobacterium cellulosilyticum]TDD98812.1 hypothetical protein E0F76_06190 [Flavobacterium cellulosilyticum]
MKIKYLFLAFLSLSFSITSFAQIDTQSGKFTAHNKGKFTISWGGNRDKYNKSDITFKGDNYEFTVENATAHDKPKGWHVDYINPVKMTIPQTNFKMGYFITDHYSISIGLDHMKYVMTQNQTTNITGEINFPTSNTSSQFNGIYNNTPTVMTEAFLMFEHTDGLNYIYTELARQDDISHLFGIKNTDKFQVNTNEGIGFGLLYPKTNTTLMGQMRHDDFHFSGYGTSIKAGINLTFFKHFTIEGDLKGGYINMPDIRTTQSSSDSASQHFLFLEKIIAFGAIFKI